MPRVHPSSSLAVADDASSLGVGRVLVGLGLVSLLVVPALVWFDGHHYGAPSWHVHARFHLLWKAMLVTLGCAAGLAVLLWDWRPSLSRTLVAWAPAAVWACHVAAHLIMLWAGSPNPLPHHKALVAGIAGADFGVFGTFMLGVIGALLDGRDARVELRRGGLRR